MRRNRRSHCLFSMTLLAVVLSAGFAVHAQTPAASTPTSSPTPSLEKEFFKNILRDQKAIWTAPFRLHREDAKWMVPSGMGVMALITTDRITGDEMAKFDRQVTASRIVSYAGSTYGLGAVAATFYLVGRKTNDARAKETGLLSAEALVDSLVVTSALKEITQRARPLTGRDRSEFFDGGRSFPSGHSMQAWSVATVIANEYHDRPIVQVAAYGIAAAVSISRFTGRNHYLSDVLVGSALGYGIGGYVYHAHHRKSSASDGVEEEDSRSHSKRWPSIMPKYDRHARNYGVALAWTF
jgi:membrane-associated phospholipid phosphatase